MTTSPKRYVFVLNEYGDTDGEYPIFVGTQEDFDDRAQEGGDVAELMKGWWETMSQQTKVSVEAIRYEIGSSGLIGPPDDWWRHFVGARHSYYWAKE